VPRAVPDAARRLRPAARARGGEVASCAARDQVDPAALVERWAEPFRFGPWVATWWRRITGRALGVAR
jgi:hypothetical protein